MVLKGMLKDSMEVIYVSDSMEDFYNGILKDF